jgi:ferric-dicitrate binding protein FerR (iron transport regulator)
MAINTNTDDLIVGFLTHQITDAEMKTLNEWLQKSQANREYFNHFRQVWIAAYPTQKIKKSDTSAAWQRFVKRRKQEMTSTGITGRVIRLPLLRIAAILVFIAFTGALSYFLFFQVNNSSELRKEITKYSVPLGSIKILSLSDGTQVWLNAGSEFYYYPDYNKSVRSVYLSGEGYFKVASNADKPFIVHTHYLDVTALGTEFNVKAYYDDKQVASILVKGKIEVKALSEPFDSRDKERKVILVPHEKLIYSPEKDKISILAGRQAVNARHGLDTNTINYQLTTQDPVQETLWKDNIMIANGEKLQDLAKKLERRYNIKIEFENQKIKKYTFTGTIKNETLDQVLKAISLSSPVNYKIEGGKVILTENKDFLKEYENLYNEKQK